MRAVVLPLLAVLLAPAPPAAAQVFFSATPSPDLRIGPLMIRATVSPEAGPTRVRLLFSVMTATGTRPSALPDLYVLWPGEVHPVAELGAKDPALAAAVEDRAARRLDGRRRAVLPAALDDELGDVGGAVHVGDPPGLTIVRE